VIGRDYKSTLAADDETLAVGEADIPRPVCALALVVRPASGRNLKGTVLLVTWYLVAACIPGAKYNTYLSLHCLSPLHCFDHHDTAFRSVMVAPTMF